MIRKLMGIFAMVCLLSTTVVAEEAAPTEEPVKIHDFNEETCMEEADFGIRYLVPDSWSEKVVYDEDEVYYEADTAQMIVYKDKRIEGDHLTEADAKDYLANCAAGDDITDCRIRRNITMNARRLHPYSQISMIFLSVISFFTLNHVAKTFCVAVYDSNEV